MAIPLRHLLLVSTFPIGQKDGLARELWKEMCKGSFINFAPKVSSNLR